MEDWRRKECDSENRWPCDVCFCEAAFISCGTPTTLRLLALPTLFTSFTKSFVKEPICPVAPDSSVQCAANRPFLSNLLECYLCRVTRQMSAPLCRLFDSPDALIVFRFLTVSRYRVISHTPRREMFYYQGLSLSAQLKEGNGKKHSIL